MHATTISPESSKNLDIPATEVAREALARFKESGVIRPARGGGLVETCPRCDGRAYMSEYAYSLAGVCFQCSGTGWVGTTEERLLNRFASQVRRDRKEAREAPARAAAQAEAEAKWQAAKAEAAAKVEAWKAENSELVSGLESAAADGVDFAAQMLDRINEGQDLTEGQLAAANRMIEDRRTAQPVQEGRGIVTGAVISAREHEESYGYQIRYSTKITVRDDRGFTVWGTLPSSLDDGRELDAWRGQRVTFTATVTTSDRDETFGYFKRPTKAKLVEGN